MAEKKTTSPEEVQNAPQQQVQQPVQAAPQQIIIKQEVAPHNGIGTAGFVLALIGIFLSWIPFLGWILWFLGALFSFIGLFKKPRGLAITGFILSFIDIIILLVLVGSFSAAVATL